MGFCGLGIKNAGLGFRGLRFRGLGFRGLRIRVKGFRVVSYGLECLKLALHNP